MDHPGSSTRIDGRSAIPWRHQGAPAAGASNPWPLDLNRRRQERSRETVYQRDGSRASDWRPDPLAAKGRQRCRNEHPVLPAGWTMICRASECGEFACPGSLPICFSVVEDLQDQPTGAAPLGKVQYCIPLITHLATAADRSLCSYRTRPSKATLIGARPI